MSVAFAVAGLQAPASAVPTAPPAPVSESPESPQGAAENGVRPDATSAMLTARASGERVEDASARTETTSTWANPDGTWTIEGHAGVQRFRDERGDWVDVDLDLRARPDGMVTPGGHVLGLRLPGQGSGGAISVDEGRGRTVSLGWPGVLPTPVLGGTKATYRDVTPGVDMVVEALRSGFEQFFVLAERPEGPVSWELPLLTKGLTARPEQDGSISFVDAKNKVVSHIPTAVAWDARTGERTGEPVSVTPVSLEVVQRNPGRAVLKVTPDAGWLADPETIYPVTVDPTYASATRTTTFDTFVQQGYGTGQSGSTELKLGNNGSGQIARSFLEFQLGSLKDKKIVSARLYLRATHAWSCQTRYWEAWKVASDVDASTVWSNQPGWDQQYTASNETKGYSSACPNGLVSIAMKDLVQRWADNSLTTNRVGLRAANESDPYGWKKFASSETANDPYISVTYNRVPGKPAAPTFTPAATYNSANYTSDTTPKFTSKASDADGNTVKLTFEVHTSTAGTASTLKASCTTGYVSSGASASCSPGTALPDNDTYHVRAQANDSFKDSAWSSWTTFKMAAATPAMPVITCEGHPDGSWSENPPAQDVPCWISAPGTGTNAPGYITYAIDGDKSPVKVQIAQSSDPAVASVDVTVPKQPGGHKIRAWATSPSGQTSAEAKSAFGYGRVGIDAPAAQPMPVTTSTLRVQASGPPPAEGTTATAELKWRLASSGGGEESGWNTVDTPIDVTTDPDTGGLTVTGTWDTMTALRDDAAGIGLDERVPTTLELQVCVTYAAGPQCTWASEPLRVLRVPHAFGHGFPVTDAGPGQIALWTGEFTTTATDVTVPGYVGDLSISRTHSTYAGDSTDPNAPASASEVFGPGWTANLDGPDAGVAGFQVIDNTLVDGTIVMLSPDGVPMVFAPDAGWVRRIGAELTAGVWVPVDDDTRLRGVKATLTGTGTSTVFEFTDPGGVTTTFKATTAPTASTEARFAPNTVVEPGVDGQVTYRHDSDGRVTRILAPLPAGMSPADCPANGALAPGCRSLELTYATATTATGSAPGDVAGQVQKIVLRIYNPDRAGGPGMDAITVAEHAYDADRRLVRVTDPRTGLSTGYAYDAAGRLTEITEPGLTPYQLEYTDGSGKVARVKRDRPTSAGGGTATLATLVYGVPTSGDGLPDLSPTAVKQGWDQLEAPTYAAAVFGPDKPVDTLDPSLVTAGDWAYASIYATDERGYTVNTATHGAGRWLPTWTQYDDHGNVARVLKAGDIAALTPVDPTEEAAVAAQAGTEFVYNTATNGPAATPAGSVVTDTYGPARWVTLADGTRAVARPHTETIYDEGSPNSGVNPDTDAGWRLPTTTKTGPVAPDTRVALETPTVVKTGYGTDVASWKLGAPRTTTQVMGAGSPDITRVTDYDTEGRITAVQQPKSSGADAGTRKTVYYTVATNSTHPDCGGKPQWAGLECLTLYAGQAGGQDLVRTHTNGYNAYLQPTTVVETANGATRTTTVGYDTVGRVTRGRVDATGVVGSQPVTGTETVYDPVTGLLAEQWALDSAGNRSGDPIRTGYDSWGRAVSYEPATGQTTTTSYDAAGRVAQVTDPKGTRSYGYGTDALNRPERRGLPTRLTVTGGVGGDLELTGAYNPDGTLTVQKLPGEVTRELVVDTAGGPTSLTYRGQVSTVQDDGTTTVDADGAWLGWSVDNDVYGRVRREWTPAGAAFSTGGLETGVAGAYDRAYTYDQAGRLVTVEDRTAPAGAGFDETTGDPLEAVCETRSYTFDTNGNRTSLTRTPGNPDGACNPPGTPGETVRGSSYDTGDRLTGGYEYDAFGRATTIPAADTPAGTTAGDLTLTYFDTDSVAGIAQGGSTTHFSLDAVGRRATTTREGSIVETIEEHYTGPGDNPTWVTTTTPTATSTTRHVVSLDGLLGAVIADGSISLMVNDLHGDSVTTIPVPGTGAANGITSWTDADEYGNLRSAPPNRFGPDYHWLGAHQRTTTDAGLLLMGARLYNPMTGAFTSTDAIYAANDTSYGYPSDPLNSFDLSGEAPCRDCSGVGGGGIRFSPPSLCNICGRVFMPTSSRGILRILKGRAHFSKRPTAKMVYLETDWAKFHHIYHDLIAGAKRVNMTQVRWKGEVLWRRPDGILVGLRVSREHGYTIDIWNRPKNLPHIKIHY